MLEELIRRQAIDILMVQEVTAEVLDSCQGYKTYYNIGTTGRGTALMVREYMVTTRHIRLASGRGISVEWNGWCVVNIYAPSGAEKRREREDFFATELPILLQHSPEHVVLGGDFNCVLSQNDCTGKPVYSGALQTVVRGYNLNDVWEAGPMRGVYTHYTRQGATRIDRIYLSGELLTKKQGVEIVAAVMSDHMAVVLRIRWERPSIDRGKGGWRMNPAILKEETNRRLLGETWRRWRAQRKWYGSDLEWWTKSVKPKFRKWCQQISGAQRRDDLRMENFLYECLYDLVQAPQGGVDRVGEMNRLRANIINIHRKRMEGAKRGVEGSDVRADERVSIHHILHHKRRRDQVTIRSIQDEEGNWYDDSRCILEVFRGVLERKYKAIPRDREAIRDFLNCDHGALGEMEQGELDSPLLEEELRRAIMKGGENKAPGPDGIGKTLLAATWEELKMDWMGIFREMFDERRTDWQQKKGMVVCIPKKANPMNPGDFRNITLLNADYKVMARVLAARFQPVLGELLHKHQYCGIEGRTMFDAISIIRDVITQAELYGDRRCVVALDFAEAFEKISHQYLFEALESYGCRTTVERIRNMYTEASSQVQINGYRSSSFRIDCSIRQGCPLSMTLFMICIDPLLRRLEERLKGISLNRGTGRIAVIAYADDVTVILTDPAEIHVVDRVIQEYEQASGARLNRRKSAALACGSWERTGGLMGIDYKDAIRILGILFTNESNLTCRKNWEGVEHKVQAKAISAYHRDWGLAHRIRYVQVYLLSKIWHLAQVLPPWRASVQRITAAIAWYIWRGAIFRVPLSTLERPKVEGGWDMIDIMAKCRTLFFIRMWEQLTSGQVGSGVWLRHMRVDNGRENPPVEPTVSRKYGYLYVFMLDRPYIDPPRRGEARHTARRRIYNVMRYLCSEGKEKKEMRIVTQTAGADWKAVWENLHDAGAGEELAAEWYLVIHDLLPTRARMKKINLAETEECVECGQEDSRLHRMVGCGVRGAIWEWTRQRIAWILRTTPRRVPESWVVRPDYGIWPPRRKRTVTWILTHMVTYCNQRGRRLSTEDYWDFLRRAKKKVEEAKDKGEGKFARYLRVI